MQQDIISLPARICYDRSRIFTCRLLGSRNPPAGNHMMANLHMTGTLADRLEAAHARIAQLEQENAELHQRLERTGTDWWAREFGAALCSVVDGVTIHAPDGCMVFASSWLQERLGVPFQGLTLGDGILMFKARSLGRSELLAPEDTPVSRALRGQTVRHQAIEVCGRGESLVLLSSASPIPARNGAFRGVVATYLDITALHRCESQREALLRELGEAKAEAERASRARTDFLARMSHELRTPMNGVLDLTEMLLQGHLPHEARTHLGQVRQSGRALLRSLNEILDLSSLESGSFVLESKPFALRRMLEELFSCMAQEARNKGLALWAFLDPQVPEMARGDEFRLRQVFENLIGNALKYTQHGRVGVWVTLRDDPTAMCVCATITDTGVGIPRERLVSLFEPFSAATGAPSGSGLSLRISRQLIERMGGLFEVESEPGRGSRFAFSVTLGRIEG